MFKSARLRLTAWYLVIIMSISLLFSVAIYLNVGASFRGRLDDIGHRLMHERMHGKPPPGEQFFEKDLMLAQGRVLTTLILANGLILLISAAGGFFLAGKTLGPIEQAHGQQKRFVGDASHELRTPITALKTSIEVALRDKDLDKEAAVRALTGALDDVDDLAALTTNLLSLAQFDEGGLYPAFEEIDLVELIENAQKKVAPLAKDKALKLKINPDPIVFQADPQYIEKMILILLDNAVKYTPEKGEVELTSVADGGQVIISVRDSGIGVAKEESEKIWRRFYRADQSRNKVVASGHGLGLSIAKKIAQAHKGSISVESQPGEGSVFRVKLPLKQH